MDKIIDCKKLSDDIRNKLKEHVKVNAGKNYKITVINNPNDEAGKIYVRNKRKACEEVGIAFNEIPLTLKTMEDENFWREFETFCKDDNSPVIVQLPLSEDVDHYSTHRLIDMCLCTPPRDADGFGKNAIVQPATPKGIIKILDSINYDFRGKHAVIVGRSDIVGRPLAKMLLDNDCTVTVCHSKTENLASITSQADLLIVAIGKPKYITSEYVKDNAVVIDVGVNRDDNGKVCGDVDLENVLDKVSHITKVPNGVGLLTVTSLLENVIELTDRRYEDE